MKPSLKSWATPLVIAAFLISAVTGILMFFHKGDGLVKPVHEWLSWALVAGGALHTAANWNAFKHWFTRKSALAIISLGAIVAVASFTVPFKSEHGNPFMRVSSKLSGSSVQTVAPIVKLTGDQAVDKLRNNGLKVADASQTIKAIAAENGTKDIKVLEKLFE